MSLLVVVIMSEFDWDLAYTKGGSWEIGYSSSINEITEYISPPAKILDAGCGSGRNTFFLAKQGFQMFGIEKSATAVQKAKQNPNADGIAFKVAFGENLPFPNTEFDAVLSAWVLTYCDDLEKCVEEIHRVLKHGGYGFITCHLNMKIPDKIYNYATENSVVKLFARFSILDRETFTHNIPEGKDPHEIVHSHDCLKLVVRKK